jgi:hypothetical protein
LSVGELGFLKITFNLHPVNLATLVKHQLSQSKAKTVTAQVTTICPGSGSIEYFMMASQRDKLPKVAKLRAWKMIK